MFGLVFLKRKNGGGGEVGGIGGEGWARRFNLGSGELLWARGIAGGGGRR